MGLPLVKIMMVKADMVPLGGTERTLLLERDALQALGHEVDLLHDGSTSPATEGFDDLAAFPHVLDRRRKHEQTAVRREYRSLVDHLARRGTDVMHVHGMPRTSVFLRLLRVVPQTFTAHTVSCPNSCRFLFDERQPCSRDIGLACLTVGYRTLGCGHLANGEPLSLKGFARGMAEDKWTRTAIARAHRVIAPSAWMRDYLAQNGTDRSRIDVVPPPIEAVAQAGPFPAWNTDVPVISFVGRLVDFKGADQLIRASAEIPLPHRVVIAGGGPVLDDLRALAASLGVADRVELLGQVEPGVAQEVRRRSAVVVVPSLLPEVYGMVGPESLASGVPVVAYLSAGTSEWLSLDRRMTRGVPVGDVSALARAIADLLREPPLDEARKAVADVVADRLSPAAHATLLVDSYRSAIATYAGERVAQA